MHEHQAYQYQLDRIRPVQPQEWNCSSNTRNPNNKPEPKESVLRKLPTKALLLLLGTNQGKEMTSTRKLLQHPSFLIYFVSLLPLINGARFIQIRCKKKHNMLHVFVTHFPAIFKKNKHDNEFLMMILNCGDLKQYVIVPCDLSFIRHLTWSFNNIL